MIVVDTTVWVDFFRGRDNRHVTGLVTLVEEDAGVALTDVILTEVLQGVRTEAEARRGAQDAGQPAQGAPCQTASTAQ